MKLTKNVNMRNEGCKVIVKFENSILTMHL